MKKITEHSGCGWGNQVDKITVSIPRGEVVVQLSAAEYAALEAGAGGVVDEAAVERALDAKPEWSGHSVRHYRAILSGCRGNPPLVLQADHARIVAEKDAEIGRLLSDFDFYVKQTIAAEQRAEAMAGLLRDAIKIHQSFNTAADMADWLHDGLAGQEGA